MKKRRRNRRTDDPASDAVAHFRAKDRLFRSVEGDWYYGTRDGDRGPFASRGLAEIDLARYLVTAETGIELEVDYGEAELKSRRVL